MDLTNYNRKPWDHLERIGGPWLTRPASPAIIPAARQGNWQVVLTQHKAEPKQRFPPLQRLKILGLANGGGQAFNALTPAFIASKPKKTDT